jgi:hypothetical protein
MSERPFEPYTGEGYIESPEDVMPEEEAYAQEPIPVYDLSETAAPEYGACMTWNVPQAGVGQPVQLLQRRIRRHKAKFMVVSIPTSVPIITQPAVPASTVAQQNTNQFPVQVVLSGFTATAVFVNGIQVGTGNGTYTVPANGSISVTYSVAGTWAWTALTTTTGTIMLNSKLDPLQGASPQGFTVAVTGSLPDWETQQPLYAIGIGGTGAISVWDEAYAER